MRLFMMRMIRLTLLSSIFLLLPLKSVAEGECPKEEVQQFVYKNAKDIVEALALKNKVEQKEQDKQLVDIFLCTVDVKEMARIALGRHGRGLNKQQMNKFVDAYRDYLIDMYLPKFKEYNGHCKAESDLKDCLKINSVTCKRNCYTACSKVEISDSIKNGSISWVT